MLCNYNRFSPRSLNNKQISLFWGFSFQKKQRFFLFHFPKNKTFHYFFGKLLIIRLLWWWLWLFIIIIIITSLFVCWILLLFGTNKIENRFIMKRWTMMMKWLNPTQKQQRPRRYFNQGPQRKMIGISIFILHRAFRIPNRKKLKRKSVIFNREGDSFFSRKKTMQKIWRKSLKTSIHSSMIEKYY